jgi:hypothetical protein
MLITLHCNPFFAPCKEKIYEIPGFFQNIFERLPNPIKEPVKALPKRGKNRTQQNAKGQFPQENPKTK